MTKAPPDRLRLSPKDLDQIRASVDWQAMFMGLGLRKADKRSKPNDWWAFSPFHEEKTPSFHMGPGGLWYDFSIGEGGGPIELVQRLEGGTCYEAGRLMIERGWSAHQPTLARSDKPARQTGRTKARTEACLKDGPANAPIRQDLLKMCTYHDYLAERGISEETCDLLGIGFLPQGRSPLKDRVVFQVADARVTGKGDGERTRVILSHLGRSIGDDEPKYLFYQGFHKSAELYGQELIWLHEDAEKQIKETGALILTEGPFDVAKAIEAGLRNIVGSFGATFSDQQVSKLKSMAEHYGISKIIIAYDRDEAGRIGAVKAVDLLEAAGLASEIFDWEAPIARNAKGVVHIPKTTQDLADFSPEQLNWLRAKGRL